MPPKLAVSTGPLWRLDLDRAFEVVKAAGADAVEILVTQSPETQSANELERLAERHDLPIVAVHAPQMLLTRGVFSTNPLEKVRRTAELCNALDVQTIVLHPPYVWQPRYALWILHELENVLDAGGPAITMENMYPVHVGARRLRFHRFGGLHGLERFRYITLDTSHLAVAEEDIVEAYRKLSEKVVHVHLSDNRGKGRDSHAPPGRGVLPLEDFVRALDGPALRSVALEVEPGPNVEAQGELERLFGESLDLVRRNLPVTNAT
ncbi:MAG: sugar phosphate isomerase/epimerase family protein [Actinomycetota bacterium]